MLRINLTLNNWMIFWNLWIEMWKNNDVDSSFRPEVSKLIGLPPLFHEKHWPPWNYVSEQTERCVIIFVLLYYVYICVIICIYISTYRMEISFLTKVKKLQIRHVEA